MNPESLRRPNHKRGGPFGETPLNEDQVRVSVSIDHELGDAHEQHIRLHPARIKICL